MLLFRSHPTQYLVLIRSDFRRGGAVPPRWAPLGSLREKSKKGNGKFPTRTSLRTTAGSPPGTRAAAAGLAIPIRFQSLFLVWAACSEQPHHFWRAPTVFSRAGPPGFGQAIPFRHAR